MNQNVNKTKRARFATFADCLYYCRQFMLTAAYKWNTIKIRISLKWIQKRMFRRPQAV